MSILFMGVQIQQMMPLGKPLAGLTIIKYLKNLLKDVTVFLINNWENLKTI